MLSTPSPTAITPLNYQIANERNRYSGAKFIGLGEIKTFPTTNSHTEAIHGAMPAINAP